MKFTNALIAVTDMPRSLKFYKELFQQEVVTDLGWNKTLSCRLTLQEHFEVIAGFPLETMKYRSNTMELYFETEDLDAFLTLLDAHPEVERLHEAKEFPWLQRAIHIFDPDGHLIEVAESMYSVACKQFALGKGVAEAAQAVQHPEALVQTWYEAWQAEKAALFSVCGTDCGACYCYGEMCKGCTPCGGKVFHVPEGAVCPIYDCTVNRKGMKNCGECAAAPCEIWMKTRDPKFSDEEFAENVKARINALKKGENLF